MFVRLHTIVESAPFKLTAEFVDLMDGPNSACFKGFREVRERDCLPTRARWEIALLSLYVVSFWLSLPRA